MDRRRRVEARRASRLNETARLLDRAMTRAAVPAPQREAFMQWAVGSLWQSFRKERMNQRILIENEIRSLGIRFPNGTVKKDYTTFFSLPVDRISNIRLAGDEGLGLILAVGDDGRCSLSGRPAMAGDFTLRLLYDTVEGEPASELAIPVAFNPNPRDLWKNIRTDPDIPYYKPDSDHKYVKVEAGADGTPRKDMVAASQRGRSHAQEGKPRDDHFALCHCKESDWYIMAVADGAGSARYSRKGSEVACKTVLDHCRGLLLDNPRFEAAIRAFNSDRDDKRKFDELYRHIVDIIFNGAKKAHEAVCGLTRLNSEARVKDFATTLMFAVCKKYDFGWFIASFWVGDGAMCLFDAREGTAKLLGTPDEGEFSGQTRFLTMREIFHDPDVVARRVRMAIVPDFTALFLMSDGVSDPMFETERNLNDYHRWKAFYERLRGGFPDDGIGGVDLADDREEAGEELLGWLDFWSPGNHDDRTIAILY